MNSMDSMQMFLGTSVVVSWQWKYIAYSDGAPVVPQLLDLSSDLDELTILLQNFQEPLILRTRSFILL